MNNDAHCNKNYEITQAAKEIDFWTKKRTEAFCKKGTIYNDFYTKEGMIKNCDEQIEEYKSKKARLQCDLEDLQDKGLLWHVKIITQGETYSLNCTFEVKSKLTEAFEKQKTIDLLIGQKFILIDCKKIISIEITNN